MMMSMIDKEIGDIFPCRYQNNDFLHGTESGWLWQAEHFFFFYPADFTFVRPTELRIAKYVRGAQKGGMRGVFRFLGDALRPRKVARSFDRISKIYVSVCWPILRRS